MEPIVTQLKPPYYAVIFTSRHSGKDADAYGQMAGRMVELASRQPGFLGIESVRSADGVGITVSYWESAEAIRNWKQNEEHLEAQRGGRRTWYDQYQLRVCKVEREYGFTMEK